MKRMLLLLVLLFTVAVSYAQSITYYQAVVKKKNGKVSGLLHKSTADFLVINSKDGLMKIDMDQITSIKIKVMKKGYKPERFIIYDPMDESNFEQVKNGPPVRKNGEKDPSLEEQAAIHVFSSVFNVLANLVLAPIHAINPSLAKYNVMYKKMDEQTARELSYYSTIYQLKPDLNALHQ